MKVYAESISDFFTAILVWLFGVLVFMPLAAYIDPDNLPVLVSSIIFVSFTFFLVKGLKNFSSLIDKVSDIIMLKFFREKRERKKNRMNIIFEIASIIMIYLLYSPLLSSIHASINGIGIIITVLGTSFLLLKNRRKLI